MPDYRSICMNKLELFKTNDIVFAHMKRWMCKKSKKVKR